MSVEYVAVKPAMRKGEEATSQMMMRKGRRRRQDFALQHDVAALLADLVLVATLLSPVVPLPVRLHLAASACSACHVSIRISEPAARFLNTSSRNAESCSCMLSST